MRLLRSFCHTFLLPYFPPLFLPKRSQNVALRGLARKLKRIHSMTQSSDSTSPEQDAVARDSTQMPEQTSGIGSSLNESANEKTTNGKAALEAALEAANETAANEPTADELAADETAESVAQRAQETMPIVGLGGSAGGIQALGDFFDNMPEESGIVFVVILHLSPHHESNLSQVLQSHTAMPVVQVMERTKVEPNHVYVIAPNRQLMMSDGHLDLSEPELPRGKRVPIDLFFRTLAEMHGQHSMCIMLSGANSDGSIGLKRIKEWGGLTIVQDPDEAEYEEMPRAAIATGLVDWVLPVAQMPQRLLDYIRFEKVLQIPPVDAPNAPLDTAPDVELPSMLQDEAVLQKVLAFLRMRTGHDFSSYKRGTVLRRIARRLHDEAGVFRGFAKLARDATREREAEEALRRAHDELEERVTQRTLELTCINEELRGSEERFSQAFMASPLPILITTLQEGRVLDLNPSALRSLGRQRNDVIGQLVTESGDWKFPSGSREQIAQRLQQEGILSNVEATYCTAAGEVRDAVTFMNIIELNGEKCILTMVQDVTERKRAEQERKQLMERIVMAQEEERRRISRELHDQMGQQLTVLMMGMKALPEHPDAGWSKPSYETQVEDLQKLTEGLMQQVHRLAWDLRPASLDNLGLEAALRQYVGQWSEQSGVQAEVVSTGLESGARPSPEVETALYRVVQEALTNVQRHAQARHVSVLLEHRNGNVIAVIEDDGLGYQTDNEKKEGTNGKQRPARLGLLGMGERMELVGGTLTIESSPGQGTTVFARASMKGREAP